MKKAETGQVVYAQMKTRQMSDWSEFARPGISYIQKKRRLRNIAISIAAAFCLGIGAFNLASDHEKAAQVMSHVTTDFEYDDTLGRLQFVSNILPDSAMVFLESQDTELCVFAPTSAEITHAWNQEEPWIEFDTSNDVKACCDGEVMTVVRNRNDSYTVRVLHDAGYESVYSGLSEVNVAQFDRVIVGDQIGSSEEGPAFELRKDGMSVHPQFMVMETE